MWVAIKTFNLGADRVKEVRLQTLITEFENMKMLDNGTIDEYAAKLSGIASKSATLGEVMSEHKLVKKFLTSLPRRFIHIVATLEQVLDLKTTGFKDVVGCLKAYEERVKEEDKANDPQENFLYARTKYSNGNNDSSEGRGRGSYSRGRGRGSGQGRGWDNLQNQVNLNEAQEKGVYHEEGMFFMMNHIQETIFMNEEKYTPPKSESNIDDEDDVSLGQATISGYDISIRGDFLTMRDSWGSLLIKVPRSANHLYKAQLKVGKEGTNEVGQELDKKNNNRTPSEALSRSYTIREVYGEKTDLERVLKGQNSHATIYSPQTPATGTYEDDYEEDDVAIPVRHSTHNKVLPTRLVDYQLNVHGTNVKLDEDLGYYNEAKLKPQWLKAMKTELESIVKNNTWKLIPLPKGVCESHQSIALAVGRGWKIHHLDVKTAFLNGDRKKLDSTLKKMGFLQCVHEKAVYRKVPNREFIIVAVNVDDLFMTGTSLDLINEFKMKMASQFKISDLGELTYYLGFEVSQGNDCVEIKQERYARKILKEDGMEDCNATSYPMEKDLKLSKVEDEPEIKATQYRKMVGCLSYLLHTRPDLTYSVSVVSRYMKSLRESHALAMKQILRYLKVTTSFRIKYKRGNDMRLMGYSGHNVDIDDGRSTTGHVFYLGTTTACQAISLREVLAEVMENGQVTNDHVSGENQRADMLTKALARIRFKEMRSLLGVQDVVDIPAAAYTSDIPHCFCDVQSMIAGDVGLNNTKLLPDIVPLLITLLRDGTPAVARQAITS
ncbi:uncharacterized mitochondrial protein-like protein [Tanacetum coccineum]